MKKEGQEKVVEQVDTKKEVSGDCIKRQTGLSGALVLSR